MNTETEERLILAMTTSDWRTAHGLAPARHKPAFRWLMLNAGKDEAPPEEFKRSQCQLLLECHENIKRLAPHATTAERSAMFEAGRWFPLKYSLPVEDREARMAIQYLINYDSPTLPADLPEWVSKEVARIKKTYLSNPTPTQ